MDLRPYRKLVGAIVGLSLMLLNKRYGIDLLGTDDLWVDFVLSAGTALSVYHLPNDPLPSKDAPEPIEHVETAP